MKDTAGTTNKFNIQLSSSDSSSLGLRCQEIDGKVCIVDVRSGSNAEKAKLEKGDYIIAIDDFIVQGKEMNICANILKENIKNNGFVMMLIERSNRLSTSNETLKSLKDPPQISKESLSHSSPPSNGKRKNHTDYEVDPEFSDSSSSHESVTSDDEAEVSEVEESKGTV
uniref:PDZ domain-containing protein n=1 Tax=Panagrolaimus superbus TaxID=310955 RepID=A0A914Y2Y7_9BILA